MKLPAHILVIRLSAPGDVAMTVPVLHSFQEKYPAVKLTILTSRRLAPLFGNLNATLSFAETKTKHKGFTGLIKLFRQLNKANGENPIEAVADLHNVLRSQVIRKLFNLKGIPSSFIDKGRTGKKELTRKENKIFKQLPTTFERYRDVFRELGFNFNFSFKSIFESKPTLTEKIVSITGNKQNKWIGIAPFATYKEKMYPLEKMQEVIADLNKNSSGKLFFFGSAADAEILSSWKEKFKNIVVIAGQLNLEEELILMAHLDVMVSMDSANMHFASLVNVPVVSVWGASHPFAGFLGWGQSMDNTAQMDLYCRPCSVFGNKACYRGDHACMNELSSLIIFEKIRKVLNN